MNIRTTRNILPNVSILESGELAIDGCALKSILDGVTKRSRYSWIQRLALDNVKLGKGLSQRDSEEMKSLRKNLSSFVMRSILF